jgi:hypothetical protein
VVVCSDDSDRIDREGAVMDEQVVWERVKEVEADLGLRVVVFSSGYQLQRLGADGNVKSVRPASFEEYRMFKMLCEVNNVEA